jgi:hypothetical protein
MADEILLGHEENFFEQSYNHKSVSDHVEGVIAGHKRPYDTFFVSAAASTAPDIETFYTRWWESKRRKFGNYAQAHQTMGDLLLQVLNDFQTHDTKSAVPS